MIYSCEDNAERNIQTANCITGDNIHLLNSLREAFEKAEKIDIIVAFLMESGVKLIAEDLRGAIARGARIRILTGNYLNITQPSALYLLKDILGEMVDLRFYNVPNRSFHPKAYIFEYGDNSEKSKQGELGEQNQQGEIFIGSSNISKSALTYGIEWNYRINKKGHEEDFEQYKCTFENLFLNHSIIVDDNEMKRYSANWRRPKVYNDIEKSEEAYEEVNAEADERINTEAKEQAAGEVNAGTNKEADDKFNAEYKEKAAENQGNNADDETMVAEEAAEYKVLQFPSPKGAQIEALYNLKKAREEGLDKAIIVAATGIGKTFLAAFDSKGYGKVLFVAHREEILNQAMSAFKMIRPRDKAGYFGGGVRDKDCDILFGSIQTLGKDEYLCEDYFSRNEFDYIIIDEAVILGLN